MGSIYLLPFFLSKFFYYYGHNKAVNAAVNGSELSFKDSA